MYLVKESKNAWICLNYNGKPHHKVLSDKTDPLSDVFLKLATEAGEFLVPNRDFVQVVETAFDELYQFRNDYGKKPVAKPTNEDTIEKDSSPVPPKRAREGTINSPSLVSPTSLKSGDGKKNCFTTMMMILLKIRIISARRTIL